MYNRTNMFSLLFSACSVIAMQLSHVHAEPFLQQIDNVFKEGSWDDTIHFDTPVKSRITPDEAKTKQRYIVKYTKGSETFKRRLHQARRRLKLKDSNASAPLTDFLVDQNAEVRTVTSTKELDELENDPEVELVEAGEKEKVRPHIRYIQHLSELSSFYSCHYRHAHVSFGRDRPAWTECNQCVRCSSNICE